MPKVPHPRIHCYHSRPVVDGFGDPTYIGDHVVVFKAWDYGPPPSTTTVYYVTGVGGGSVRLWHAGESHGSIPAHCVRH